MQSPVGNAQQRALLNAMPDVMRRAVLLTQGSYCSLAFACRPESVLWTCGDSTSGVSVLPFPVHKLSVFLEGRPLRIPPGGPNYPLY